MLVQFTVKNFKSIRDKMTFDMQAASITEHTESLIVGSNGEKYLPITAIYGPNGGGKSTVLEAMNSLVSKVMRPIYAVKPRNNSSFFYKDPIVPFAFSGESKESPTEYEIFFSTEVAEYRYILHVKDEMIRYETLDRIKHSTKRKAALLYRDTKRIELKGDLVGLKLNDTISPELPILSFLGITYENHVVVRDVIDWLSNRIIFMNYGLLTQQTMFYVTKSEAFKNLIIKMIREMDIDVTDYRIQNLSDNSIEIYTQHIIDDEIFELRMIDESSGTVKIFELLPFIASSIINGQTLIIDELDSRLHPLLLKYIIELFTSHEINRHGAQLVFTSHDLSTMNNEVFRRDEIWFVAKGRSQNSKLYSLVEFKNDKGESVRKDAKYDKQYLEGKYGADPYLQKIIDWSQPNA